MIISLDTNVLLAALISSQGASHRILRHILQEELKLALSTAVVLEYDDVLKRPDIMALHRHTYGELDDLLDVLILLAQKQAIYYRLRPNLIDEGDNLFFECAFASQSEYLITSNIKDFKNAQWKGAAFNILTPRTFYQTWNTRNE